MNTKVISSKAYGPYDSIRTEEVVNSLGEFTKQVRNCFEDSVDAVAVVRDGAAAAIWIAEPDVDCDQDGFYEVAPAYAGQEYTRYAGTHKRFWNYVASYFGTRYIPADAGFIASYQQRRQVPIAASLGDSEALTVAERNPSMAGQHPY